MHAVPVEAKRKPGFPETVLETVGVHHVGAGDKACNGSTPPFICLVF